MVQMRFCLHRRCIRCGTKIHPLFGGGGVLAKLGDGYRMGSRSGRILIESGRLLAAWTVAEWRKFAARIGARFVGQNGRVSRRFVEVGGARGRAEAVAAATSKRCLRVVVGRCGRGIPTAPCCRRSRSTWGLGGNRAAPFRGAGGFRLAGKTAGRWQASPPPPGAHPLN